MYAPNNKKSWKQIASEIGNTLEKEIFTKVKYDERTNICRVV